MRIKIRIPKRAALLLQALMLLFVPAGLQILAETNQLGDEAWQQELLKEREQKDIEFKTSATSPMAGSKRLTITAPGKTFITIVDGAVSTLPQAGAGTVFAVFPSQGKWYWSNAAPDVPAAHRLQRETGIMGHPPGPPRAAGPARAV